jgi:hypothetical protein
MLAELSIIVTAEIAESLLKKLFSAGRANARTRNRIISVLNKSIRSCLNLSRLRRSDCIVLRKITLGKGIFLGFFFDIKCMIIGKRAAASAAKTRGLRKFMVNKASCV